MFTLLRSDIDRVHKADHHAFRMQSPSSRQQYCNLIGPLLIFARFANVLQASGLAVPLSDSAWIGTVFAPTDDAFTALLAALNLTPLQAMSNISMITEVIHIDDVILDVVSSK